MTVEDFESLLSEDFGNYEQNEISSDILQKIDAILCKYKSDITDEVFVIYKKFLPMKQEAPENMKLELFGVIKSYIKERIEKFAYADALLLARFLIIKSGIQPILYSEIAEILVKLEERDLALDFIKIYEVLEKNRPLCILTVANFYNIFLHEYKTAIKYYEKYLRIDETKSVVYTIVGSLYAKVYGDFSLKEQICYYEKAYKLNPKSRVILLSLALACEKFQDIKKADKYYSELLQNNPSESDYYNYGAFLISCGNFELGHKYLTHRFNIKNNPNLVYPIAPSVAKRWDLKSDISGKTLLVYYEQGFGDTIMYSRYLPELNKLASHIIFVVQDKLFDLIKNSEIFDGIEILSDSVDISAVDYDFDMALLDVPCVVGAAADKIPYTCGYIDVPTDRINDYRRQYITKTNKLKVGIAYNGDKNSNYDSRDVDFTCFKVLSNLKNIELYSFNMEDEHYESIKNLGYTFNDFTDTACALKCMDIVISTDNVILNLAGALGVKTYGLFSEQPNFRWFKLKGDNVGWYKSVLPIHAKNNGTLIDIFDKLYTLLST